MAAIEALIASDVIRFTGLRPALTALNRAAVLQVFGIDPSLTVFTNLLEAAHTVAELPWMFEQEFAPELLDLYRRLGLTAPPHGSLDQAVASVHRLAGAVLEVSWQFAVCAVERGCDPSFVGPLDKILAASVIKSGFPDAPAGAATRHFDRLEMGAVPNLKADALTIGDALAIREGDAFAGFRSELRRSLDGFDHEIGGGHSEQLATEIFEQFTSRSCEDGVYPRRACCC